MSTVIRITPHSHRLAVTTQPHKHDHEHPHRDVDDVDWEGLRTRKIAEFLEAHFGEVELILPDDETKSASQAYLVLRLDSSEAQIHVATMVGL